MWTILQFTALYSFYIPIAANEVEVLHIHRKRLTSMLKNKVDMYKTCIYILHLNVFVH